MKKRTVRIYVYEPPERVSHVSPLDHSPMLLLHLRRRVKIEEVRWNGKLSGLPKTPVMVRASFHLASSLGLEWDKLAAHCEKFGHVVFYDDRLIGLSGEEEGGFLDLAARVNCLLTKI